ncbi:S8 family peptidase [Demetria terragena]|uniref:S8 family peptidase n=1 Tax=Demetria terragena TaxID=63959 RepID=UPI00036151B3|nr:S8 family peptidase [Demetria terragena]
MNHRSRRTAAAAFAVAAAGTMAPFASAADAAPTSDAKHVYVVEVAGASRAAVSTRSAERAEAVRSTFEVTPRRTFRSAMSGFSASMTPQQAAALEQRSDVVRVVRSDFRANVIGTPPKRDSQRKAAAGATWGLDRIDQRQLPLNSAYSTTSKGAGVTAYVIDTGVNAAHPDFGGRATQKVNFAGDGLNKDCNGHGTHVGGTVGSTTYGVAKAAKIVGVKAFTCAGDTSLEILLSSLDWVTENAQKPAVVNTSWQFEDPDGVLKAATERMNAAGITHATASGNSGGDNCSTAPRHSELPIVVGNSTKTDDRNAFSSTGACVDVYAPGTDITSLDYDGAGTAPRTGTSMASPHVAGVAALYLEKNPNATPAQVKQWIEDTATPDVVNGGGTGGTVNRLLFTGGL